VIAGLLAVLCVGSINGTGPHRDELLGPIKNWFGMI
jgi:hypothetical protein